MEFIHLNNVGATLPSPVTDFSSASTMVANDDGDLVLSICLFGGCLSSYESRLKTFDVRTGIQYVCPEGQLSDLNLVLAPGSEETTEDDVIQQRQPMPRPRYRHTSVAINGKIWIVGGRDANNNIINEIDVYDEVHDEWTTFDDAEGLGSYGVSDHCAFSYGPYLFIVGGYDQEYKAVKNTIMIRTIESLEEEKLNFQLRAPMNRARGGCSATTTTGDNAIVAGGFTHEDGYCEATRSVEMYSPQHDKWKVFAHPMAYGRAKPSLLRLDDNKIFAFGGETRGMHDLMYGKCHGDPYSLGLDADIYLPNRLTYPVDHVEIFDFGAYDYDEEWYIQNSKWVVFQKKVNKIKGRYRYIAASIHTSVYFFGGIKNHNSAIEEQYTSEFTKSQIKCDGCFSAENHIFVYDRSSERNLDSYIDEFMIYIISISCTIAVLSLLFYARRIYTSRKHELEENKKERGLMMLNDLSFSESDDEDVF